VLGNLIVATGPAHLDILVGAKNARNRDRIEKVRKNNTFGVDRLRRGDHKPRVGCFLF